LDQKGQSGTPIDDTLWLAFSMKDATDSSLISAQSSYRLPPLKKIHINYIPPSGDASLCAFLSKSIPKHLPILQFNESGSQLVDWEKYIEGLQRAFSRVTKEIVVRYFELKKQHLEKIVDGASHVDALIIQNCKVEVGYDVWRASWYDMLVMGQ
jgi:hypothetical protein